MDAPALVKGLSFVDSFFPSGGYAFSSGLEAAVQGGAVRNGEDLTRYVEDLLRGGISRREAVAAGVAHQAGLRGDLRPALVVDGELDAMKTGRESRLASRQMGRQVIKIAADRFENHAVLLGFRAAVEEGRTPGHLPVCIGLTLGACGWTREETVAAYLYQSAVGLLSAAMKLLPIGQREGQRLLDRWTSLMTAWIPREEADLRSWTPVQDIYAMCHSCLESRLFRS